MAANIDVRKGPMKNEIGKVGRRANFNAKTFANQQICRSLPHYFDLTCKAILLYNFFCNLGHWLKNLKWTKIKLTKILKDTRVLLTTKISMTKLRGI